MAYYLQMDGVDDRIALPSMTFTEVIIDFKVSSKAAFERYWSLPLGAEFFQVASGGVNDQWSAGVSALYLNGVAQTNSTVIMVTGTRGIVRSVLGTAKTAVVSIFANGTGSIAHGDIWDVKIYNGVTLQAHYDMTLGNVQDQSGNGRHATLTGGTFVDDGSGGSTEEGSATLQGVGTLTTVGNISLQGSAALQGAGTITAAGQSGISGTAMLQGVGTLSGSGSMQISGAASLQAVGTLQASGGYPISGSASLQGVGTMDVSGIVGTISVSEVNLLASAELIVSLSAELNAVNLEASRDLTATLLASMGSTAVALEGAL